MSSGLPVAMELQRRFDGLTAGRGSDAERRDRLRSSEGKALLADLCDALESGHLRVTEGNGLGEWRANVWVKRALVALSGAGMLAPQPGPLPGSELDSLGWRADRPPDCRVPAGSFLRRGAYLAPGSAVMPPTTVQAGAAVLEGAQVDSHVLLGSGVLVGEGAVVGCGSMLAGSLLPEIALAVVLERGVVVGGNCGLYGPLVIGERSMVYAGTVLRAATGVFDPAKRHWLMPDGTGTLRLPNGCTVCMGVPPAEAFADGIQRVSTLLFSS